MTDQNQQAELPPKPKAIVATIAEATRYITEDVYLRFAIDPYISALEAALAAANRRAEEAEKREQEMRGKLDEAISHLAWSGQTNPIAMRLLGEVLAAIPTQPEQTR